jgi:hypothetical protein
MFMRLCRLIEDVSREGVAFSLNEDSQKGLMVVPKPLLRHDIDFSLYALEDLAKLESDLGQEAIYLFRPDSRTYNLFSLESMNLVKKIQDMGHKIGLHIDRRSISDVNSFDGFVESIKERFHTQVGVSMNFVSWHRPFEEDLGGPETIFGMNSLYSESRWNKSNYISDSAGSWNQEKEGKLFMFCASREYFHLLIHPEWWINDSPSGSFSESMSKQFCDSIYALKSELRTFDELNIANRTFANITDLKNL